MDKNKEKIDMNEEPYKNREIDEKFDSVHERFDNQDKVLTRIETQVKLTNGRVNKLERALYIVAAVVGTLLITSGSELVGFIKGII